MTLVALLPAVVAVVLFGLTLALRPAASGK
jgi:hypothetical protein